MRITHKKTVDKQALGAAQADMDRKRAFVAEEMKELRQRREAAGAKPGEGRVGGWHRDAVLNAIESEGPEVMSAAAEGYWRDMTRLYPEACADGRVPGTDSINGQYNRYGRVRERFVGGRWVHWDDRANGWVEGQVTKKKGIR